ncbi:MAG: lamin tail domain-containing protein [Candidatus Spechtbacteria bacterium]|nr:lamin tail domain-containing protein [Candidatus Spechtbacteria bacterium]
MILSYTIKSRLSNRSAYSIILAIFYYIIFTSSSHAGTTIIINEIAWAGSTASANDEWMELYNPTDNTVNIDGWHLQSADGSPSITLRGIVPAGGYFLLERTDDQSVPNIAAGQIYSGALSNNGEKLMLADTTGAVQDVIDGSYGWLAGDAKTKQTMERNLDLAGWHAGPINGTPLAKNTAATLATMPAQKNNVSASLNIASNKTINDGSSTPKTNLQQQDLLAGIGTTDPQQFSNELKNKLEKPSLDSTLIVIGVIIIFIIIFVSVFIYRNKRTREAIE